MGLCRNCRPLFQIIFTDFWTEKVEMSGKKNKKVAKKIFLLTLANGKLPEKKKKKTKQKEFSKYRSSCSQVFL